MLNRMLKLETTLNHEQLWAYKSLHFFLDRINFRLPLCINGKIFCIPIIYGMGIYHLLKTESFLSSLNKKLFDSSDGAFFNVGANVGQTLLKFKSLGLPNKYIGLEPNAGAYFYLVELIKMNRFQNCQVFPFALSEQSGAKAFFRRHRADVSSTMIPNYKSFANDGNQTLVLTYTGDQLVQDLGNLKVNLIKIDVEGAELEVLRGFKNTLMQHRPFVICEILPVYHLKSDNLRKRKERQDLLLKEVKALGYEIYRIKDQDHLQAIETIEVHSNLKDSNYLFVPIKQQAQILRKFEVIGK